MPAGIVQQLLDDAVAGLAERRIELGAVDDARHERTAVLERLVDEGGDRFGPGTASARSGPSGRRKTSSRDRRSDAVRAADSRTRLAEPDSRSS